jgi:GTP pyrophosphokinase
MTPHPHPSRLQAWHDRAGALAPALAAALEACATRAVDQAECADVLDTLAMLGCDAATQAAALWFALAQADPALWQERAPTLPEDVRRLVEGQQAAEKVWTLHAQRSQAGSSEGLRRLLLAIIRDLRVVFVLLARQLARMRAATALAEAERHALARLTRDIHAPLANRLGIWQLKWELEDLAFRYLQPDTYKRIARLLDERRADREAFIAESLATLGQALHEAGIRADLAGRPKHIYSIWKKMQKKGVAFTELYDIRAVRVLVDTVADCYAALGVVHTLWVHLPREFDDYLARPKGNGYRSLHTAVIGPRGKTLEVQIRTHQMHHDNELGVAAHWRYKEGGGADAEFEAKIAWMRKLLETRGEDDGALAAELKTELMEDRVYLLTPKGEVVDLPHGGTVLDFAYHVHTEVGHRCRGAKVNGRIVPLTFQPQSGDRVEILTAKLAEPSRDWLSPHHGYLNSARARDKVRAWFRRLAHDANLAVGRAMFERERKRLALPEVDIAKLPAHFHLKNQDELLIALALNEISPGQIAHALQELAQPPADETSLPLAPVRPAPARDPGALSIEGIGNLLTTLARCCQPLPGDPVRGYVTKGRGVSVHRADCAALARLGKRDPDRVIEVAWGKAGAQAYEVDIELRGYDRKGLQKDVTNVISNANTPILASSTRAFAASGEVEMRFALRVRDFEQLSGLLGRLLALPNVVEARRVGGSHTPA